MPSPEEPPSALGALLARHKDGDPAAANEIIAHCVDRFRHFARAARGRVAVPPPRPATDDIVNELVVRLIRRLRGLAFDHPAQFLCYAAEVVRNHLLDLAQKRKPELVSTRGDDPSGPDPLRDVPDSTDDPEKMARWGEVHALIAGAPDDDRRLFDLIFYQNLSRAETAAVLGVSDTTVGVRWQHARLRFMRRFGDPNTF